MAFSLRTGLALSAVLLAACHRQLAQPAHFASTAPVIDGQATEWDLQQLQTDAKSHLQYAVLNDARTVYVRLKTDNEATQRRLLFQGLTVWLDSTGQNRQQFGVHYPLGGSVGAGLRQRAEAGGPAASSSDRQARLGQLLSGMHEMQLLKLKGSVEPTMAETHTLLGVHAAAAFDATGNLIYELAVPLRLLYKRSSSFAADHHPVVGVTLLGGVSATPNGGRPLNSNRMGGGMGRGGHHRGPGGPSGPAAPTDKSAGPVSIKTSVQLSFQ